MKSLRIRTLMVAVAASVPALAFAQVQAPAQVAASATVIPEVKTPPADTLKTNVEKKEVKTFFSSAPKVEIQHIRPYDMLGLNVYESPKEEGVAYTGFKLNWGAGFTQQFQGL